jgi:hypothetical protein
MLNILDAISVSVSIHICIGIGWEMKNPSFWLSYPHCQSSITKIFDVFFYIRVIHREPETKMPRLLGSHLRPFEPAANCIFMWELNSLIKYFIYLG